MFDDKEIERMTIVYTDGSMTILTKNKDGSLNVERRDMIPTNYQVAHGITLTPAICAKCLHGSEEE